VTGNIRFCLFGNLNDGKSFINIILCVLSSTPREGKGGNEATYNTTFPRRPNHWGFLP
jgi:hypothetical protein